MLLRTLAWKIILYDDGIVATVLSWFGATDVQLIYTPGAVLIATIYDFLPFMILPIYTTLIKIDRSHIEAAHDLGANGLNIPPSCAPAVRSGNHFRNNHGVCSRNVNFCCFNNARRQKNRVVRSADRGKIPH